MSGSAVHATSFSFGSVTEPLVVQNQNKRSEARGKSENQKERILAEKAHRKHERENTRSSDGALGSLIVLGRSGNYNEPSRHKKPLFGRRSRIVIFLFSFPSSSPSPSQEFVKSEFKRTQKKPPF